MPSAAKAQLEDASDCAAPTTDVDISGPRERPAPAKMLVARPFMPRAEAITPYLATLDETRWYSNFGPLLVELEARLKARFEDDVTLAMVANGTQALTLALMASRAPQGVLCAVPSWTFVATLHAIVTAGMIPWMVDVDPDTWMLDPERLKAQLYEAPGPVGAVIPVGAFGRMPDLDAWARFRDETGLPVIADCAAGFDACVRAPVPVMVSLHATKALGIGEGGFIASRDKGLVHRIRETTAYGFRGNRESLFPATNAKLSEYAAAVGMASMDAWPSTRLRYAAVARLLKMALTEAPEVQFQPGWGSDWITSTCVARLPDGKATAVEQHLSQNGVDTRRWWGLGCHTHPAFANLPRTELPVTAALAGSVIGLPYYADMTLDEVDRLAVALIAAVKAVVR
jgi:dTDP-4-amino-4,6-dideoxygalactose transaminase